MDEKSTEIHKKPRKINLANFDNLNDAIESACRVEMDMSPLEAL
jgi:hypothetical protein